MSQRLQPHPLQRLRPSNLIRLGLVTMLCLSALAAQAADSVWGALVYAKNTPGPAPVPSEIQGCAAKLKKAFGYNELQILGQQTKAVDEKGDRWLIPGQDFSLLATVEERTPKGYRLQLQLFQGKRLLVTSRAELGLSSPLIIKGPLYADGQLLFILEIR